MMVNNIDDGIDLAGSDEVLYFWFSNGKWIFVNLGFFFFLFITILKV